MSDEDDTQMEEGEEEEEQVVEFFIASDFTNFLLPSCNASDDRKKTKF